MAATRRASIPLVLALVTTACGSPVYVSAPIEGTVVDADTSAPIAGVVVTANWQLYGESFDSFIPSAQLAVIETVTDEHGRFHIDGFIKPNWRLDYLYEDDPRVIFFKGSYDYERWISNYPVAGTETPGVYRKSELNGRTIKLKKLAPTTFEAAGGPITAFYRGIESQLYGILKGGCGWKEIPKLISAMDAEKRRLLGLHTSKDVRVDLIGIGDIAAAPRCGKPNEYFAELSK